MAEHSSQGAGSDLGAHRETYQGFVKGAIVLVLVTAFVMVSLVSFRFAHVLSVFTGFAGLIVGILTVVAEARTGATRWLLPLAALLIFGLITAINVS
jgi:Bacterial aa3 type cytochrome c oxidase subunit IV